MVRKSLAAENPVWRLIEAGERVGAVLLMLLTLPVIASAALAVRLLSGRAPFIAHKRVGWRGTVLWMLKLRTMWEPSRPAPRACSLVDYIEDEPGSAMKDPSDDRVPHAFARFCRRHSLDELPQFWHVIRGEMSLVGPRPITISEIREHYHSAAEDVLMLKPGIAGLWQTSGRARLSYQERLLLDLHYVRHRSFRMYIGILFRAAREVWTGSNTW